MQIVGCAIERFGPWDLAVVPIRFEKRSKAFRRIIFRRQDRDAALPRGVAEEVSLNAESLQTGLAQFESPNNSIARSILRVLHSSFLFRSPNFIGTCGVCTRSVFIDGCL